MILSTSQVLSSILAILLIQSTLFTVTTSRIISCLKTERDALLQFKATLVDPSDRLSSWNSSNCCQWRGVRCDNITGHVSRLNLRNSNWFQFNYDSYSYSRNNVTSLRGEINPSLLILQHLIHLDLSYNNFNGKPIPQFISSFKKLRYLNLSTAGFSGAVPLFLGNLSSLHNLHFPSEFAPHVSDSRWLSQLTALRYLDMSGVSFTNSSHWLHELNSLPSIEIIRLRNCGLQRMPLVLPHVNFTSLYYLDLSINSINSTIPTWLFSITSLEYLDLSLNRQLHGILPNDIGNLTSLNVLILYWNSIHMSDAILQLGNLHKLQYLDISYVPQLITSPFDEIRGNFSKLATTLQSLRFKQAFITGSLPHWIGNFTKLRYLDVSTNFLSGEIPASLGQLSQLQLLNIGGNRFNGTVPESLGGLSELLTLDLSYNKLEGVMSETHFRELWKLQVLRISSNSLVLNVSRDWNPPFQLYLIDMSNCLVGPEFPLWLYKQKSLAELDLSHVGISGTMPDWFWSLASNLCRLDLSFNGISGKVPSSLEFNVRKYKSYLDSIDSKLDLSSNFFEGPLPHSVGNVESLALSNNSFSGPLPQDIHETMPKLKSLYLSMNQITGTIPSNLCQLEGLKELDISRNSLIGELPDCWKHDSVLKVLDFSFNNLSGKIPDSVGSLPLVSLTLSNNKFSGEIPSSLQKCVKLYYLDLGHNKFIGNIPTWLGEKLRGLFTLILRSNMFVGGIPPQLSHTYLRILDLSDNNLTGTIPEGFGNFTNMKATMTGAYLKALDYSPTMELIVKSSSLEYERDLPRICLIDLSENNLYGSIPHELTNLKGLMILNLSGNHLTGDITNQIGSMTQLESLDLSRNELLGAIPATLSNLSFLSWMNFSYNNLSGEIPRGGQLSTFNDPSVYIGNEGLCGLPLSKKCLIKTTETHVDEPDLNKDEDLWFYLGIITGFVVGSWSVWVVFLCKKSWKIAYFLFVEHIVDRLYVSFAVNLAHLRRSQL
ncbi:hypothetical protein J5N97_024034 [Dioscorea zingiberensis]|uniref:Leucine-rich repeat-containing N-terminal plant-type domain-containing protein n=1 Tax=Dioscorea zingiberensis TaxID=325984 RepID=A0A9D5C5U4_9LILI|nr:hypothetical protein J5N97_024034 [Dioscorea zingiberensis]